MAPANLFRAFFGVFVAVLFVGQPARAGQTDLVGYETVTRESAINRLNDEIRSVRLAWMNQVIATSRPHGSYLDGCRRALTWGVFPIFVGYTVTANMLPRGPVVGIALLFAGTLFALDAIPIFRDRGRALRAMQMEEMAPLVVKVSALFRAMLNGKKEGEHYDLAPLNTLLARLRSLTGAARRTEQVRVVLDKMWLDLLGYVNLVEKSQSTSQELMEPESEFLRAVCRTIREEARRVGVTLELR